MDTKRIITIYTSSLSFAKMKQEMPSKWSITAIKRLFITGWHWIFVKYKFYWLNKKQRSGEENDTAGGFLLITNQLSTLENLQND